MLEGLSIKMRVLMRLLLRWNSRRTGASGFELMLTPSREDPGRYTVDSVRGIDRRTMHRTLRSFGLAGIPSLVPSGSILEEQNEGSVRPASPVPRITFVRLTPKQVLRIFVGIRKGDPDVRRLYEHLEAKNLELISVEVRGAVMRAFAADGAVRGEGIVIELPHRRADGAQATFYLSIKDWTAGGGGSGEVKADYEIRRGERVDAYEIKDGSVQLVKRSGTPRRSDASTPQDKQGESHPGE